MDLTALIAIQCGLFELGLVRPGPNLLGRWIGSMAVGQFVHSSILDTPSITGEIGMGVVSHYVIGITLSSLFLGIYRLIAGRNPGLASALAYGCATCVLPWFLMFPAMGFGVMGFAASPGLGLVAFSTFNHLNFGLWICVWSRLFERVLSTTASASISSAAVTNNHRRFWSKVARRYDRVVERQLGPKTRALFGERLAQEDRLGNLAEFGCGTGYCTSILAGRAARVTATDLSPEMLALAKERNTAANVTFQEQDCQKTTFADAVLDAACLSLVLHFTEPETTLAEMHRILKPGGRLIIAVPALGDLTGFNRFRSRVRIVFHGITGYRVKPPNGISKDLLTGQRLGELVKTAGFTVLSEERIVDPSRSSNVPVQYLTAVKR
jgi:SAM-dependent methyltransferase